MFSSCLFFIGSEPCKISEDLAVPLTSNLEEGDAVVLKSEGLLFYGIIKWKGNLPGWGTLAGVEMVREVMNINLLSSTLKSSAHQTNLCSFQSEVYMLAISIGI